MNTKLESIKSTPDIHGQTEHKQERIQHGARLTTKLAAIAIRFAGIERAPRYTPEHRENDAEHSFMLAIVAPELAYALYPEQLDIGLVHQYASYHDLTELETGDIPTYLLDEQAAADKEVAEQKACQELAAKLPPHAAKMLLAYESQHDPESRFVRRVDKLLPVAVDILGMGSASMREDYGIHSHTQLLESQAARRNSLQTKFGDEFSEILDIHTILSTFFSDIFTETM